MNALRALPFTISCNKTTSCEVCPIAKQTRKPFPLSTNITSHVFDLIHSDIWGPYKIKIHGTCSYFLSIVDDCSRCTWTFLFQSKDQVPQLIKKFVAHVQTQFHYTIKQIRSDNGSEFLKTSLSDYFKELGITQQTSCVDTPQNGIDKRKHRHLLEMSRALRFQSHVPLAFWGDCILTATYLLNRLSQFSFTRQNSF